MLKTKVYAAHGDGGERGIGPVLGYYSTHEQAKAAAKGQAWYGGDGFVQERPALLIDGQTWLLAEPAPIDLDGLRKIRDAQLLAETLAGLTDEQRRVLGYPASKEKPNA